MSTKNKPNLKPTTDKVPNSIPIEWMMRWTSEQKDPGKAAVVKELISSFVMHNAFPSLALQLDEMQGNCNPVKQDERNAKSIAEKIEEKVMPLNIEQFNCGNGIQSFPEKPNSKSLNQ